jgi:hypothetical protein
MKNNGSGLLYLSMIAGAIIAAWLTHIVVCIQNESWILLLAGAVFFPIGIVHGFFSWFGVF